MPTTDEMILALVKTGKFTLPRNLDWAKSDGRKLCRWILSANERSGDRSWNRAITKEEAHDLCAMHFARETEKISLWSDYELDSRAESFANAVFYGDSAAAIAALHEAVCGKGES